MIKIYMESNKLCKKSDIKGELLFNKICENRWLPIKGKSIIHRISNHFIFFEFSTPWNFEKQFLNLTLALKDWDIFYNLEKYVEKEFYFKALDHINHYLERNLDLSLLIIEKCRIFDLMIQKGLEVEQNKKYIKEVIKKGLEHNPFNKFLLKLQNRYE